MSSPFKLRLMTPAPVPIFFASLPIDDQHWFILERDVSTSPLEYICISYLWGDDSERYLNPIYPVTGPKYVSKHTIPALKAAITNYEQSKAFWIDAFSIPIAQKGNVVSQARSDAIHESIGYIYSHASAVAVVLAETGYDAFSAIISAMNRYHSHETDHALSVEANTGMDVLEKEYWIRSVWAYPIVMSNRNLSFLSRNSSKPALAAEDVFNSLTQYVSVYCERQSGLFRFDLRNQLPRLDAFEALGRDWLLCADGTGEKYALQVMANMDYRGTEDAKSYWYPRIMALSNESVIMGSATAVADSSLAERFMRVCEEKGDFSYVFSAAAREEGARRWRPRLGELPTVVPSRNTGKIQKGEILANGSLKLHDIAVYSIFKAHSLYNPIVLSSKVANWLKTWNNRTGHLGKQFSERMLSDNKVVEVVGARIFRFLRRSGYTGCEEYILLRDGYFFPQWKIERAEPMHLQLLVSSVIDYAFGHPGMAMVKWRDGTTTYVPGVLVGQIDKESNGRYTTCLE